MLSRTFFNGGDLSGLIEKHSGYTATLAEKPSLPGRAPRKPLLLSIWATIAPQMSNIFCPRTEVFAGNPQQRASTT